MCHVQSLEKDFYIGALGSFNCDFTLLLVSFDEGNCDQVVILGEILATQFCL